MGRFTATATTTTATSYPATVGRVLRPRPERNGTMVVCGLACPSPQSSATTRPWFLLGAALLDRIPCYRTQTLNPSGTRQDWIVLENLQGLPVGEPNSSHLETSSKRPTHRRPPVGTAKNEGGKLALSQPPLAAPLELPVSGRYSRRDEVKETKRKEAANTAMLFACVLPNIYHGEQCFVQILSEKNLSFKHCTEKLVCTTKRLPG